MRRGSMTKLVQKGVGKNPEPGKPKTPRPGFPVHIHQGEEKVPTEVLAEAIVKISEGFLQLKRSGLNRRAIVVLVKDASGVGIYEIQKVLNALEDLRRMYT